MLPTPPGPYQSHLLRSLLSYTRRWVDRGQEAVRNVQVVAGWSLQILLYPVYALFQTTRVVGQQIGKTAQPEFPRLQVSAPDQTGVYVPATPTLTSDRPLEKVLQTVQGFAMTPIPVAVQPSEVDIRGIATQLEGRSLVLVTRQNQVLNILTPRQQQELEERMIAATAAYHRPNPLWQLPRWVGRKIQRLLRRESSTLFPAPVPNRSVLAGSPAVQINDPVWESLSLVQHLVAEVDAQIQANQLAIATALTFPSTIVVRGVASLLGERSLVLVTSQNQVLDVLTCEQQAILEQRIVWEVANYYRYWQLRQRAQGLIPLRPPSPASQAWLPVRIFQGLMAWMQSGPIAIATNLFQEASLPPADLEPFTLLPTGDSANSSSFLRKLQDSLNAVLTPPQTPSAGNRSLSPTASQSSPTFQNNGSVAMDGRSLDAIDADVTLVGYELSWLERVIRWLDQCFLWVESLIGKACSLWAKD